MKTDDRVNSSCSCSSHNINQPVTINHSHAAKIIRRCKETIKLVLPAVMFAIIPKCPVCLVGYVALGTGIGLSVNTATYLRIALIMICVSSISYFIVKHIHRFLVLRKARHIRNV